MPDRPRRWLLILLACLPLLAPLSVFADERILDYRSDIQVLANGELTVTETIRVRSEGKAIRRGIYREFPTRYRDRWGNHVVVQFTPLELLRDGQPEPWHTEDRSNGVRVYFGTASRLLEPGVHEYAFTFATNRQLGFFEDHDELYFNAVGHDWQFPVDHAAVTVRLPFTVPAGKLELGVYTGAYGTRGSNATAEAVAGDRMRFETTQPLRAQEGMTVVVAWPKGLIAEPGRATRMRWFLDDNGAALVLILGWLFAAGWYLYAWNRVGRDPKRGVIIPRFEPPRGLSPAACRYVMSMHFNRDAFAAAVISLAVKGQLAIEEDDGDFTLLREHDAPAAPLTAGERAVLERLLPSAGSRIMMEQDNYKDFQAARGQLKSALKKEYLGRLFRLNTLYLAPPVLATVAAAIIAAFLRGSPAIWIGWIVLTLLLHGLFAWLIRAPTPAGRKVMDEIEGFKSYLDTAERDRLEHMQSPRLTPEVFEAFLPYAFALGVENSWCRRFENEIPQVAEGSRAYNPAWYRGDLRGVHALGHIGGGFSKSFGSAIASASSAPGSSSGSGGGGFSGGGGGGGGGGGW
jgi:uncharacterized protein (TIGR04222 family)